MTFYHKSELSGLLREELDAATWIFETGQLAFMNGEPRACPCSEESWLYDVWLNGWDAAKKVREWGLQLDIEAAQEDAERARAEIKLWRLRHSFAVIDGKKPGSASDHAQPGCSTQR